MATILRSDPRTPEESGPKRNPFVEEVIDPVVQMPCSTKLISRGLILLLEGKIRTVSKKFPLTTKLLPESLDRPFAFGI